MPPDSDTTRRTWFVIAAYNEESVIRKVVADVRAVYPNVVVVDDGSEDNSGAEALSAGARLVTHPINLGQGAALQTGITYALRNDAGFIVTFDADGQHRVDDVSAMLDLLQSKNCDVVLGSRFVGTTENIPTMRRLFLKAAILFTRVSTGLKLTDTHNGLRVFRAEAAGKIRLQQNGMAHASEILEQISQLEMTYVEAPVNVRYTEYSLRKGQKTSNSLNILIDLIMERFTR